MRTEVLEVDERFGREYTGRYVFKELTWAKRSRILQKHTTYSDVTGKVLNTDYVAIQAETIMASLREQPPSGPVTLQRLLSDEDGVPGEFGELLSNIVNRLSGLGHQDLRFLLEQLSEDDRTRLLRSFGYAKNSLACPVNSGGNQQERSSSSQ